MTAATRFRYQLFTGLAVALLLLTSGAAGGLTVVLAAARRAVCPATSGRSALFA